MQRSCTMSGRCGLEQRAIVAAGSAGEKGECGEAIGRFPLGAVAGAKRMLPWTGRMLTWTGQ